MVHIADFIEWWDATWAAIEVRRVEAAKRREKAKEQVTSGGGGGGGRDGGRGVAGVGSLLPTMLVFAFLALGFTAAAVSFTAIHGDLATLGNPGGARLQAAEDTKKTRVPAAVAPVPVAPGVPVTSRAAQKVEDMLPVNSQVKLLMRKGMQARRGLSEDPQWMAAKNAH